MSHILAHSLEDDTRSKDVAISENVSFESLFLSADISKGLHQTGFRKPSPIQLKAIPVGRCGFDLIVKSKSGTGKTLVFAIIALENLDRTKKKLQTLILAPTREIAVQIQDVIREVGCNIEGLVVESFIGGLSLEEDKKKCKQCQIAVGTPGRLKHLITDGALSCDSTRLFILDEADKLMEDSFRNDINQIYNTLPAKKQIITTSATYPNELETFLGQYMQSPTQVNAELETPLLLGLKQFVSVLKPQANVVQQMRTKNEELLRVLADISFTQCLVFSNYQTRAESISNYLNQKGWKSLFISAAQNQTQRLSALSSLKDFKCRVMLSTDLTARGIDAAKVDLVVNYDVPVDSMTYLHRMGRAGRYGAQGVCLNLAFEGQELEKLRNILGQIGGCALGIPKLPEFKGHISDLVKINIPITDQIFGKLDESNMDLTWDKNKVYELKKERITNEKHSVNHKEMTIVDETSINDTNNEVGKSKNMAKLSSQKPSEIRNIHSDTSDCTKITHNDKSTDERLKPSEKTDTDKVVRAEQTKQQTSPKSKALSNQKHSENSQSDIMDILTSSKNELDEMKNLLADMDPQTILTSLANQNFSMDTGTIEGTECTKTLQNDKSAMTDTLLALLSTDKNIKPAEKVYTVKAVTEEQKKHQTFTKNKALLDVARLLDSPTTSLGGSSIEQYLNLLKEQEKNKLSELLKKPIPEISNSEPVDEEEDSFDIENIYKLGYDSIVTSSNTSWKHILEKVKLPQTRSSKENHVDELGDDYESMEEEVQESEEVEIMKWVPVKKTSEAPRVGKNLLEDSSSDNDQIQDNEEGETTRWMPGRSDTRQIQSAADEMSRYEHYSSYFDDCDRHLWQNGLNFDNTNSFDEWFHYEWEAQLYAIRNYVQQNIYVEEMSRYQSLRTNKEGN